MRGVAAGLRGRRIAWWFACAVMAACIVASTAAAAGPVFRVDHVADGDTITLTNGQRVRFVQIDTPEVYFGVECYGRAASKRTKQLLQLGAAVRREVESASTGSTRWASVA